MFSLLLLVFRRAEMDIRDLANDLSLDNPLFADFERMPATFDEFITNPYYLGKSWKNPFPAWVEAGGKMFPLPLRSPYNTLILLGATGIGKALRNDQKVLTKTGFKKICKLRVGEFVASTDGKYYPVVGIFPQGVQPVYRITFGHSNTVYVSDNHIWTVSRDRGKTFHDETTAEILEKGITEDKFYCVQVPRVEQIEDASDSVNSKIQKLESDLSRTITGIRRVRDAKCTCISITAPNHLYLTEHCIPTHNTSFAVNMVMAYYLHIVLCLKNPHEYFALEEQKKIVFAFINIVTKTVAYRNAWGMFHKALLQSPFFMEYGIKTNSRNPEWECTKKPILLIYGAAAEELIGLDILACFLDEVSFARNQDIKRQMEKAKVVFDAALERIQSRFTKFGGVFDGLIIMASSKRTDQAFAEVYAKELMNGKFGKQVFVFDRPRWEVLPPGTYSGITFPVAIGDKLRPSEIITEKDVPTYKAAGYRIIYPPIETYDNFSRDMMTALTNIAGESVNASGTFLAGEHIGKCINPEIKNLFRESVIRVGTKDDLMYQDFCDISRVSPEDLAAPIYIHLDASLGNDGNSISGGRILYAQDQRNPATGLVEPELHYKQIFKVKVRAPKGDQVMLRKNEQFIYWLRSVGFNIACVSSDQYQSAQFRQDLTAAGIPCVYQSIDRVTNGVNQAYSVLRNAIYEHRVQLLADDDQTEELLHLVKYENGKVDKPGDGNQDDASQCLCGWINLANQDKEHYIAHNVVLSDTLIGTTGSEKYLAEQNALPTELVINHAEFMNEFGAYKTQASSGLRQLYDAAFSSTTKKKNPDEPPVSPLNFF